MIVEQNSDLKVLRHLVRFWYKNFSIYEIAKEANLSPPTSYNIIKKLESKKILLREGKRVKLNFNNPFSYSFKLMYDSEKILDMTEEEQNKINHVYRTYAGEYGSTLLGFMIFGSAAVGEQTEKSDVDFLIIVKKKKEIDFRRKGLLELGNINIIEKEENELEKDYLEANELMINALMNGIIIFDNGIIKSFLNKPLPALTYEWIMQKKERLNVIKERLFSLLKEKNYEELTEQMKLFIIEKARILLLERGIVPSSKKNIIDSLKTIDKQLFKDYTSLNKKNVKDVLEKNV